MLKQINNGTKKQEGAEENQTSTTQRNRAVEIDAESIGGRVMEIDDVAALMFYIGVLFLTGLWLCH